MWLLVGAAAVLFVVVIGVVVVVATGGGDEGETASDLVAAEASTTTTAPASTTTTAAPTTTTTLDPVAQSRAQYPELYEVVLRLENIITQSTEGREGVGTAVEGVKGCTITPYEAERMIEDVIFNRTSVLNQVSAVTVTGDAQAAELVEKLQRALEHSISADRHYSNWMNYLYTDYYYTTPIGCPSGRAPTNSEFDAGNDDSGSATQAKQDFVAMYNPIAESLGLRTWEYSDI